MSASWFLVKCDNLDDLTIEGASEVRPGEVLAALTEAASIVASDRYYCVLTRGQRDIRQAIFSIHEREMEDK